MQFIGAKNLHLLIRLNSQQILLPPFDRLTVRLCSLSLSGVEERAVSEVERRLRDQDDEQRACPE